MIMERRPDLNDLQSPRCLIPVKITRHGSQPCLFVFGELFMMDEHVTEIVPVMSRVYRVFQGRHTAAAFAFFVTGNVFHYIHRLDGTYIAFMSTLMGFILGHSVKEDYFKAEGDKHGT